MAGTKAKSKAKAKAKSKTKTKAKAKSKALAKREKHEVMKPVGMPDYIRPEAPEVNIEPGEMTLPLIKLLQANSSEVNCESPLGKAGEFFNIASQEVIGTELYFVAVLLNRKRIAWKDFEEGGGMLCRSYDNVRGNVFGLCAECIDEETGLHRNAFGPNGEKPLCTKYYDFVTVAFPEEPDIDEESKVVQLIEDFTINSLSIISFGTTKVAAARRLIMIAQAKKAALYANVFKMTRKFVEQKGNKFYVPELEWFGWSPPELYEAISNEIGALRAVAGNPEAYTEPMQPADENQNGGFAGGEASVEDDDDLPF